MVTDEQVREYVTGVLADPSKLAPSISARKDFGPGYGYRDREEWWEAVQANYPSLFTGDDPVTLPDGWLDSITVEVAPLPVVEVPTTLSEAVIPTVTLTEVFETESDPVVEFLKSYDGNFNFLLSLKEWVEADKELTPKQYAAAAKCLDRELQKQAAKAATAGKTKLEEDGIYYKNEQVYKVVHSKNGANKPYAKVLNHMNGSWSYVGQGPLWELTLEDKMTLEDAKEFGKLYGICCNCGATLTDENSIEDGIGPVCKKKFE